MTQHDFGRRHVYLVDSGVGYDGEGGAEMGAWEEAMERWSVVSFIHVIWVMQGEDRERHYQDGSLLGFLDK